MTLYKNHAVLKRTATSLLLTETTLIIGVTSAAVDFGMIVELGPKTRA